jgi:hypothetical protein
MAAITEIEIDHYVVTDGFFGRPYVDSDEWRDTPAPHRHIHGGFEGTDTRFTFYYPAADRYQGRLYHPLEGANAGHEDSFGNEHGNLLGGLEMIIRLGGYMVESNMGHIGDVMDPKAGDDATIYAFRAAAESARFSKYVAAQIYGEAPAYAYVWGGSGGGRRSPGCLEYGPDVWDGALPFMGGGEVEEHGTFRPLKWTSNFPVMFNVQRILGDDAGRNPRLRPADRRRDSGCFERRLPARGQREDHHRQGCRSVALRDVLGRGSHGLRGGR